jgi:hypothetical protein
VDRQEQTNDKLYSSRYKKYISEQPSEKNAKHMSSAQTCANGEKHKDKTMRNTLFATAAAFALILGAAPTFAAEPTQSGGQAGAQIRGDAQNGTQAPAAKTQMDNGAMEKKCVDILANKADHTAAELADCQKK